MMTASSAETFNTTQIAFVRFGTPTVFFVICPSDMEGGL